MKVVKKLAGLGGLGFLLMVSGFAALYTGVKMPGLNEVLAGWLDCHTRRRGTALV